MAEIRDLNEALAQEEMAKKKKKKLKPKAVIAIIIIGLIAAVVAFYMLNPSFFPLKDYVVGFFISQDTTYQETMAGLETEKTETEALRVELESQMQSIESEKTALEERTAELDAREEAQTSSTGVDGTQSQESAMTVAVLMENMTAAQAAGILNNMTSDLEIANILTHMEEQIAAEVLAAMKADKAASVARYIQ